MMAVLGNAKHPEYGSATVPLPIPNDEYGHVMELLGTLGIGDVMERDCKVEEIQGGLPILKRLEKVAVNIDELDYLAKRLDSFDYIDAFLRGCLEQKYDLYEDSQRITPNPELLDSLMEDIPEKRDFDPNWTLEDLPRIFPRLCQKYEAQMVTWSAKGPLPAKAVERNSPPCADCLTADAVRHRIGTLTADEETILAAIVLRYAPESTEQTMELLDRASEYTILKGVNCYESLGRYYLAHETSVPEELYEYMNLDALGCHYEDEHPGVFVGNDYVQYPSQTQTMSMKME